MATHKFRVGQKVQMIATFFDRHHPSVIPRSSCGFLKAKVNSIIRLRAHMSRTKEW